MTVPPPMVAWIGDSAPVDVVDFVERTTYSIWNARHPELVAACYLPETVIWADAGDIVGEAAVTDSTVRRQRALPGYSGVIADTIWTGNEADGYRTSMRWTASGLHEPIPELGLTNAQPMTNSSIANCVILHGWYVEEWGTGNASHELAQLGLGTAEALLHVRPTRMPVGPAAWEHTQGLGVKTPPVPDRVDGAGLFVTELLDDLYNRHDTAVAERRYAAGAPYGYGVTRAGVGAAMVQAEVDRWLGLLPDLRSTVDELYWQDDAPGRARVAVRHRLSGTAFAADGSERPVELTAIHHVHVRGDLVVAEWVEHDELALLAQLAAAPSA